MKGLTMKRSIWIVIGGIVLACLLAGIIMVVTVMRGYNHLVTLDEEIKSKWAQVENQYQRRADLIPNLVETVKAYAEKEETIFTEIANARARIGSARTPDARDRAETQLSGFLSRLLMITENYPQLKANQNFLDLQAQLEGTENRISVERQRYIERIKNYNIYVKRIPGRFIAALTGFQEREFFEAAPEAQNAPKVDFGGKKE